VNKRSDKEELLWRAQQLQNASADIDGPLLRYIEKSRRVTKDHAAWLVTGDEDRGDALRRFDTLMDFLLQPADELTLEELERRNELMKEYRLPSLLRIYKPDVLYEQFCAYLREYVWPKWDASSVKKSRVQRPGKKAVEKKSKKPFGPGSSDHRGQKRDHRGRFTDHRGRFTDHRKKNTDLG
jgi:hypothetical protein